jgi:hypothetical protein
MSRIKHYYHDMLESARRDESVSDVEYANMALRMSGVLRAEIPIPEDMQVRRQQATNVQA